MRNKLVVATNKEKQVMSKKSAALVLALLVVALLTVNVAVPSLHFFLKVGTVDSMFAVGKTVGNALAQAFGGSSIIQLVGIVLFLA
ncbi:MAG: hypothetical protein HY720_19100 [Planctomycetes bacterium]|nr:hypothetical protein [Planctomycetota bacterium]